MSEKLVKIKDFWDCEEYERVCLEIVVKEIKGVDTTGKNYSQTYVTVEDRTGEMTFPIWRRVEDVETEMCEGMLYRLYGNVGIYRNENQLKYITAKIIDDTSENRKRIDPSLTRGITKENEIVFKYVIEKKFDDERYKRYAEVACGLGEVPEGVDEKDYRERYDRIKSTWCSSKHHDNYKGGLVNHIVGMLRIVLTLKAQYAGKDGAIGRYETKSEMNWDQLLLLCYIHDIEKHKEYLVDERGLKCEYNADTLVGHVIEGVARLELIHNEVESELRLNHDELEAVKYSILCHHGQWGNFEMKSSEDKVFHAIDLIDACNVDELRLE